MNWLLRLLKLPLQQWLYNPDLALHSVVVVRIWKGVGYNMMVFLAGLQSISQELYEVAALDGASAWARFPLYYPPAPETDRVLYFRHGLYQLVSGFRRNLRHDARRPGGSDADADLPDL